MDVLSNFQGYKKMHLILVFGGYKVKRNPCQVATSDGLEQLIILGEGAVRVSARELQEEVEAVSAEMRQMFIDPVARQNQGKNYLLEGAPEEVTEYLERSKLYHNGREN